MLTESNRVEFKREINEKLEREIVAFLNYKEGGALYIGIDDDGTVVGVADVDALQLKVTDRLKNNIQPSTLGLFDIVTTEIDGKSVLKILISSGPDKPYHLNQYGMSSKGCFIRVGSSVQPMNAEMIDHLYSKRTRNSLGKITSPRQELTFAQLKIFYEAKGFELNQNFAQSLELLTEAKKFNYAAYLLADENGVSIKLAKYAGTDKIDLIENAEYGYCSLIKATNSLLDKLEIENITKTKITSKYREEKRLVDPSALREAILNAIVHNDYTTEIPPLVEIFSDKIVITSTGGLPQNLTQDEFFSGISAPRNKELMRVFKDVKLVEQLGSGMGRIMNKYDRSIFDISPNFLRVTFSFDNDDLKNGARNGARNGAKNGAKNKKIDAVLTELKNNKNVTIAELEEVTGISRRQIQRILKDLTEAKTVERYGSTRSGVWIVSENFEREE